MIDLHCHLLPGIDDGAADLDEALDLARLALDHGITHAALTPHILPGIFDNERESIEPAVDAFRDSLAQHGIPLQVSAGGEMRLCAEVLGLVTEGRVPFLGRWQDEQVLLLELPHGPLPPGSDKLVTWLRQRGIRPLLGHPERNPDIMRDPERLQPFMQLGCLVQVTAGSLTGRFGARSQATAELLLERGWVTVLASDAHNGRTRPPELVPGVEAAAEIVGEDAAWALVRDTPAAILGV